MSSSSFLTHRFDPCRWPLEVLPPSIRWNASMTNYGCIHLTSHPPYYIPCFPLLYVFMVHIISSPVIQWLAGAGYQRLMRQHVWIFRSLTSPVWSRFYCNKVVHLWYYYACRVLIMWIFLLVLLRSKTVVVPKMYN